MQLGNKTRFADCKPPLNSAILKDNIMYIQNFDCR